MSIKMKSIHFTPFYLEPSCGKKISLA